VTQAQPVTPLISDAEAHGIVLEVRGDKLRCWSNAAMPPGLRDMLREHKADIIKELERRAAAAATPAGDAAKLESPTGSRRALAFRGAIEDTTI